MKCGLLTIGNELLSGVTVNTNASWLGNQMLINGMPVQTSMVVGDSVNELRRGLNYIWENHDIVITTGGLGPTHDDRTVRVIADFFGTSMEFHKETFRRLKNRLSSRDIEITERHRNQCMLPKSAEIIPNESGTAPAMHFTAENKHMFCLPGVPFEMKHLMETAVLPRLKEVSGRVIFTRVLRTVGVPESTLYNTVKAKIEHLPEDMVAFLPHGYGVDIRIMADNNDMSEESMDGLIAELKGEIGTPVYAEQDETMASVIGKMLKKRKFSLATAESCTGGLLADELTNVSGSSEYFLEGLVTYSNKAKINELNVPGELIESHGAVSEEVAHAMARGVLDLTGSDTALSTTGIAGPTGGSDEKPVGLVYIGCGMKDNIMVNRFVFTKDRRLNKVRSVYAAMNMLRLELLRR